MNPIILLAVAAGAALLLLGGKRKSVDPTVVTLAGFEAPQALPIRVPAPVTSQPEGESGAERESEDGRSWGTFYVNRDKKKHYELKLFTVAEDAGNAAIGNGEVIADVYETIVASGDWEWGGQSCRAKRVRLTFRQGHLQKVEGVPYASADKPLPTCLSARPMYEVYARSIVFVQRGPDVYLVLDTESGVNRRSPDKMVSAEGDKPGKFGSGTGRYGNTGTWDTSNPQWDNRNVASAYLTVDVSWIFNPTDAQGNPI